MHLSVAFYIEYWTVNSSECTNYVRFSHNKVTIRINNLTIDKYTNFGALEFFKYSTDQVIRISSEVSPVSNHKVDLPF